jgi:hypothetical protein
MAKTADEFAGKVRKCIGFGAPKGSGKTTFYLSQQGIILDLMFDLGSVTVPPGKPASDVFVQDYPDTATYDLSKTSVERKRGLGDKVAKDLLAIVDGFKSSKDIITLSDGSSVKKPDALVLDGMTRLDEILVDLICAINGVSDPTGLAGGGTLKFYGDRLNRLRKLFTMVISLPINVACITWEDVILKKDDKGNVISRTIEPDLGGKLNVIGAGYFDSCLYHYHDGGKYMVRTKPTPEIGKIGVRGSYGLASPIDVTIDVKTPSSPYERVFGVSK